MVPQKRSSLVATLPKNSISSKRKLQSLSSLYSCDSSLELVRVWGVPEKWEFECESTQIGQKLQPINWSSYSKKIEYPLFVFYSQANNWRRYPR
jgi:hypothetical protein